jgi:BlaI family penicillinase repressor
MGRKRHPTQLTPLELEIMKVLWDTGPATVQTVQGCLPGSTRLAYTTVQTMLNVLHRKGKVRRALKSRAYEYEPVLSRQKATSAAMRDIINRLFGGSAESLVMSLVESRHLTREKLARLSRLVEKSQEAAETAASKEAGRGNA